MKKIGLDTFMDFRKDDRGVRGQGHENSMLAADYLSLRRSDGRRFSIGDFMCIRGRFSVWNTESRPRVFGC